MNALLSTASTASCVGGTLGVYAVCSSICLLVLGLFIRIRKVCFPASRPLGGVRWPASVVLSARCIVSVSLSACSVYSERLVEDPWGG